MAEYRLPNAVASEEIDLKTVRVVFVCEGIETGRLGGIKNAEVKVEFKEMSLCVTADVKRKKGPVKYKKIIKRLPSAIEPDNCSYKCKKDQIVVTLKKKEETSWSVQLSTSGLDQSSSEESD